MSASGNDMNCETYRESITADPSESFAGGAEHSATCEACSTYRSEIRALDDTIRSAVTIDVPELRMPDLPPPGKDDAKVVNLPFRRAAKITTGGWIGIAASLAAGIFLAAMIGVRFMGGEPGHDQLLAREVLDHVDHEPWALKVTDVAVSDARFERVTSPAIRTMDRNNFGLVSYAQSCLINGNTIPHLVIQGEKGPITLLLMPEEMVSAAVSLSGQSVDGVILPHGKGSIAIVAERDERIEELQRKVVDSVEWTI